MKNALLKTAKKIKSKKNNLSILGDLIERKSIV